MATEVSSPGQQHEECFLSSVCVIYQSRSAEYKAEMLRSRACKAKITILEDMLQVRALATGSLIRLKARRMGPMRYIVCGLLPVS
jgi:hypothetical protein